MLGILGGMGPLATADFFAKLVAATPAHADEAHIPTLILSDPRIPPRPPAILGKGESPLPALLAVRDRLLESGATMLAMPCNTAHFWYADLVAGCAVPFVSIIESACGELATRAASGDRVAVIATRATLATRLYEDRLRALGYVPLLPDEGAMHDVITPAIERVKGGQAEAGGRLLAPYVEHLLNQGVSAVLLACTETP
ncbi:MAG: aspartate/glutamate racemase family protein, partial [Betaproteobacteria bacterium]|nr:aspartate/glutamate racemase family protein [Betaproteobacteria bacterium]